MDDLLSEYDIKRDLVEVNRKAAQWTHKAVWNKWYTLSRMWADSETDITRR